MMATSITNPIKTVELLNELLINYDNLQSSLTFEYHRFTSESNEIGNTLVKSMLVNARNTCKSLDKYKLEGEFRRLVSSTVAHKDLNIKVTSKEKSGFICVKDYNIEGYEDCNFYIAVMPKEYGAYDHYYHVRNKLTKCADRIGSINYLLGLFSDHIEIADFGINQSITMTPESMLTLRKVITDYKGIK